MKNERNAYETTRTVRVAVKRVLDKNIIVHKYIRTVGTKYIIILKLRHYCRQHTSKYCLVVRFTTRHPYTRVPTNISTNINLMICFITKF